MNNRMRDALIKGFELVSIKSLLELAKKSFADRTYFIEVFDKDDRLVHNFL